jgi:lysozyme
VARRKHRIPMIAICAVIVIGLAYALWPRRDRPVEGPPSCDVGPTVSGIDVSYYQDDISWKRVHRAGIRFAFIRTSDGIDKIDERFAKNWSGAKHAGVMRGAYQYFRPDQDPNAQADMMIVMLGKDRGELPPVIDVETDGGKSPDELAAKIGTWIARVRDKLGVEPIVYTGPEFWTNRVKADYSAHALWLAHYTRNCPTVPAPWSKWTFWQYTDNGRVPGIEGAVDLDVFAGTMADLEEFARTRVTER